jgi:hypothetical protein
LQFQFSLFSLPPQVELLPMSKDMSPKLGSYREEEGG